MSNLSFWLFLAVAVYGGVSVYVHSIESQYRLQYHRPLTTWKRALPSHLVSIAGLLLLCWIARLRMPFPCFLTFAIAAASLRGVFTIDRLLLIIPDRLQLIGAAAGLAFLFLFIGSGEDGKMVLLETGFALAMVLLLWLLSYVYLRIRNSIGFGMGDLKLLAWISLFVGKQMPDVILTCIGIGIAQLFIISAWKTIKLRKLTIPKGKEAFAFGPSIVLGVLVESLIYYG